MKKIWNNYLPFIILGAAIITFMIGINLGQAEEVFQKAILICLECIGVG